MVQNRKSQRKVLSYGPKGTASAGEMGPMLSAPDAVAALEETFPEVVAKITSTSAALRFGEELRLLRTQNGLTQADLAHATDIDQSEISSIERGRRKRGPTIDTADRLIRAAGGGLAVLYNLDSIQKENEETANPTDEIASATFENVQTKVAALKGEAKDAGSLVFDALESTCNLVIWSPKLPSGDHAMRSKDKLFSDEAPKRNLEETFYKIESILEAISPVKDMSSHSPSFVFAKQELFPFNDLVRKEKKVHWGKTHGSTYLECLGFAVEKVETLDKFHSVGQAASDVFVFFCKLIDASTQLEKATTHMSVAWDLERYEPATQSSKVPIAYISKSRVSLLSNTDMPKMKK